MSKETYYIAKRDLLDIGIPAIPALAVDMAPYHSLEGVVATRDEGKNLPVSLHAKVQRLCVCVCVCVWVCVCVCVCV